MASSLRRKTITSDAQREVTELWLIRHAESVGNRDGWFQGQEDPPITPEGHDEARRLADRLRPLDFDAIYSSDLRRAYETAQYVGHALDLSIREDERLREVDLGRWEGLSPAEVAETYPDEWAEYTDHYDPTFRRGDGESYADGQERIVPALEEVANAHPGQRVVVVFHGGIMRSYLTHLLGLPFQQAWRLPIHNTSITRVRPFQRLYEHRIERPGAVVTLNDTAHLDLV